MGPSFVSMLVFVVRGIVYLCSLYVDFPGFYFVKALCQEIAHTVLLTTENVMGRLFSVVYLVN